MKLLVSGGSSSFIENARFTTDFGNATFPNSVVCRRNNGIEEADSAASFVTVPSIGVNDHRNHIYYAYYMLNIIKLKINI